MAAQHPIALHTQSVSATASWPSEPGSTGGVRLCRPPAPDSSGCEIALAPRREGHQGQRGRGASLVLVGGMRLVELQVRGAGDRELQYVGTLRGTASAAPAGAAWRFTFDLPAGWAAARLKLLSLVDKGSCVVDFQESQGREEAASGPGAAAAGPPAASGATPLSQLDELRLLVQHAAAGD
jgi:hypothetical protein